MTTVAQEHYTAEEITANRVKYIAALRREGQAQCYFRMFMPDGASVPACAIGVALHALWGFDNDSYDARADAFDFDNPDPGFDPYGDVARALGIPMFPDNPTDVSVNMIYGWNDDARLTFPQIADKLAQEWGL